MSKQNVGTSPPSPRPSQAESEVDENKSTILDFFKKLLPESLLQGIIDTEKKCQQLFKTSVEQVQVNVEGLGAALDTLGEDQRRNVEEFALLLNAQMPSAVSHIDTTTEMLHESFQRDA